ncbi:MAG TPA: EamA family transporter RarD [Amaricoccus sp.]|nr:EamA family transporter RarD [Amaricoccus sp.]
MTEEHKGVLAIAGTATIWGLSSIFYKALADVPPLEVLSHRTLWSVVFILCVLAAQGRVGEALRAARQRQVWLPLAASAVTIAANWFLFIAAVQQGRALEASLGYYIFPLLAVALGFLVLGERFTAWQSAAIGLAAAAVVVLTLGTGTAPWTALAIAGSFGLYGLVKARLPLGPLVSVFAETLLLLPLALGWITWLGGGAFGQDWRTSVLLAFSGPLTGGPLMLFAYATRRIPYATVGLVQYWNPTLQFAVAVWLFGEPFSLWHGVAFAMIWSGLGLYSWGSWRR